MAVTRVFGRVDGTEVIFNRSDGDRWNIPVPLDVDGEYVVEIVAEDDAGNQSYMAKILFCVNSSMLCVTILPVPFYAELLPKNYVAELIEPCCRGG